MEDYWKHNYEIGTDIFLWFAFLGKMYNKISFDNRTVARQRNRDFWAIIKNTLITVYWYIVIKIKIYYADVKIDGQNIESHIAFLIYELFYI